MNRRTRLLWLAGAALTGGLAGVVAGVLKTAAGGGVVAALGAGGGTTAVVFGSALSAVRFLHDDQRR